MPFWYFEKDELKNTPSFRDGIDSDTEARYRREGARFLMECGINMGLRHETMATGVVFYHRFYMFHSFNEFPRYITATCCLFLAGKVEETPKKCKDIIKAAKAWLEGKNLKSYSDKFTDESIKEIMVHERILLQTIKFDLQVDHPYGYLLKYAKTLKGNQEQIRSMVQMAWTFINDSFCTTLCLQWEPEIIAIALMYLTSKLSKLEVTDWNTKSEGKSQNWWDQFVDGLRIDILEDICHQILDLYSTQQAAKGAPTPTTPTSSTNNPSNNSSTPSKKKPIQSPSIPPPQSPSVPSNPSQPNADYKSTSPVSSKVPRPQAPQYNETQYQGYPNQSSANTSMPTGFNQVNHNQNPYYQQPPPPPPPQAPQQHQPHSNMYPGMNVDQFHLNPNTYNLNNAYNNGNNSYNQHNPHGFPNQQNTQSNLPPQHHGMFPNGNAMSFYQSQSFPPPNIPPPPPPPIGISQTNQQPSYNYPQNSNNPYQNNRGNYNGNSGQNRNNPNLRYT